jgi:hypothetical protein
MNVTILTLNLAGTRVRLEISPETFAARIREHYRPFVCEDVSAAPPALTARVMHEGSQAPLAEGDFSVRFAGAECLLDSPGACGRISLVDRHAEITLRSALPLASLEYFLRTLYALLIEAQGGLMLHCAGVLTASGVQLFVGHSGSGKTTASALSSGHAVVLNDDLIVLLPEDGRWRAYGTPFWNFAAVNREGQTASGFVIGIHKLVKDVQVYLEPISRAAAVAELFANCPVVNADPGRAPRLLARCRQLATAVPMQQLHFRKDPSFWEILKKDEGPKTKDGGKPCS